MKGSVEFLEYCKYMKKVTDSFVLMQSDNIEGVHWHDRISTFDTVEWKGGMNWCFVVNGSFFMSGITLKEAKEYNSKVALEYLKENSLSFKEWKEIMGV